MGGQESFRRYYLVGVSERRPGRVFSFIIIGLDLGTPFGMGRDSRSMEIVIAGWISFGLASLAF